MQSRTIIFLLNIGFLCLLPLVGTTVFNTAKQIAEYYQYGFYYYECALYYYTSFDKTSFDICKSMDITTLLISFPITTAIFTFMANSVRKEIIKFTRQNRNDKMMDWVMSEEQ